MSITTTEPTALASFIERAARDETFNLDKFRELLVMQREADTLRAKHEFNVAMSAVQANLQRVAKDKPNDQFRSRYATMQSIDAVARPAYTEQGFSIRFGTAPAPWEGWIRVTCELAHIGGYSEQHYLDGPLDKGGAKTGIQGIGSTVSYLRRYLMLLVLNLVTADDDDDDGNGKKPAVQDQRPQSRRDEINEKVPLNQPAKKVWGPDQFLDWFQDAARAAADGAEFAKYLEDPDVVRMRKGPPNAHRARLEGIIAEGTARFGLQAAKPPEPPMDDAGWPGPDPEQMRREREAAAVA